MSPRQSPGPREVFAPPPTDPFTPNVIDSVVLQPGERVRWEWTELGPGRAFVSGYTILPAWRRRAKGRRGPTPPAPPA